MPTATRQRSFASPAMDTMVTITVVGETHDAVAGERADRALAWFRIVEAVCSRTDGESEVMRLAGHVGEAVSVGPLLFRALHVALDVARATSGAFDPAIVRTTDQPSLSRGYRPRPRATSSDDTVTYRDIVLDADRRTVTLRKPLVLDLGGIAKGLAVDLARKELEGLDGYCIDAGGDVYLSGYTEQRTPWRIGLRHPQRLDELMEILCVTEAAICTSICSQDDGTSFAPRPHRDRPGGVASATVVAPSAIRADALSTAAYILGPRAAIRLFERQQVAGLLVTSDGRRYASANWSRYEAA